MEKVLTVVVPTYNMEKYLDRCLSSLIIEDDKMDMLEVLVINDGSKDRSSEIAHGYEARYPQTFRVIDKENGNYGSCVNRGMDEATGKYFRILDADDWVLTGTFSQFIHKLAIVESDIVFTKYSSHWSESFVETTVLPEYACPEKEYKIPELENDSFDWDGFTTYPSIVRMHQMTIRLALLKKSQCVLQEGISYTDTEFCYFPCKCAESFMFFDIDLYQYDCSREGQTMSFSSRKKSLGNMKKIAVRLLMDYHHIDNTKNKQLAAVLIKSIIYVFYTTALVYCKMNDEIASMLDEVEMYVKNENDIFCFSDSLVYRRIKYVKLWRNRRLSYLSFPLNLYDKIWSVGKKMAAVVKH